MDFKGILSKLDQLNEGVEVVSEKAVSQAQQKAAGAALAAKRGDIPKSELTGASKEMLDMSKKDLEDFAGTKHKGIPKKKTNENYEDLNSIRKLSGLDEADEQDIMDKLQQIADGPDGEDELLMKMNLGIGEEGMFLRKLYKKVSNKMFGMDDGDLEDPEDFDKVHAEVMSMFGIEAEPLASLQQKAKDREISSALSDPELTGESLEEETMDLSDKSEELTQWVLKYDDYRGDNGDALPMGWIKSMTATGVSPDGWEVKEWNAYQDKLGKDITDMDDAEIDAFIDNPQNSPITSAMIDDLLKITGASTADEDLARSVSSAIGLGESLEEEADIDLSKYSKEMLDKIKNASDADLNKMAMDFGGSSMEIGREEELFRKIRAQLKKQDEGFDRDSFRKAFEAMVESKFKKGDKVTVDGEETEITVPDGPGPLVGVKKDGKTDMVKADKVKKKTDTDESVEEGKSKHPKGSEKYKKQMAAKHASMNEDEMDIDANMDMPVDPDQEMTASPEQVIDQADEIDMAMGQLEFIKYAAEEIKGHFKMGFEMEEWFQNKLARVHGTMMTLHAYIEGEEGKAGMNESINESIEKFFQEDKLGFEDALRVVRESGGQQTIRFADTALYKWASRVANAKFEGRKAELYAGLLYERNGGDIEITDVLNESE